MNKRINHYLKKLERDKDIKILLACETGSRAWGFPSPDSDYDVRIIYRHRKDWYLSLSEKKDTIDIMYDNNDIDISGWDLRKALRLLRKSNPALLERIQSPLLYESDSIFLNEIKVVAANQYSRIATIHHYLSMAKKFLAEVKKEEHYRLKKFFYALRSTTACLWILEKEALVPIEFQKMLQGLDIAPQLDNRIQELIAIKATQSESYGHQGEAKLIAFMEECIQQAEDKRQSLPSSKGTYKALNSLFMKTLNNDY